MTAPLVIRPATPDDRPRLRQAIIELQNYERLRHRREIGGRRRTICETERWRAGDAGARKTGGAVAAPTEPGGYAAGRACAR